MPFRLYWLGMLILMSCSAVSSCATTQTHNATVNVVTLSKELRSAAYNGDIDKVRLLLQKGADVNAADKDGTTPLHVAISKGNAVVVRQLLAIGANVHAADKNGMRPLHTAAQRGDLNMVNLLLAKGANAYAKEKLGMTSLDIAIIYGKKDVLEILRQQRKPTGRVYQRR